MKVYQSFLPIVGLICFFACNPVKTAVTEVSPSYSLANYSSFAFFETSAEGDLSENYQKHLDFMKSEISKHMSYRGLLPASNGEADLLINIGILVEKKAQTRETGLLTDPGTFNYIGQQRYTWKSETVEVGQYRKGSVDVHLVDAKNNEAVWAGVTTGVIDEKEDKLLKTISKGVSEMFEKL
jgi:hypothetical protein